MQGRVLVGFTHWLLVLAASAVLAGGCDDDGQSTTPPATATPTHEPTMFVTEGPDAIYPVTTISGTIVRGSTPVSGGRLWVMVGEFAGLCAEASVRRNGSFIVTVPLAPAPAGTPECREGAQLRFYYRAAPGEDWYEATQRMTLHTEGGKIDLTLAQLPFRPEPTP